LSYKLGLSVSAVHSVLQPLVQRGYIRHLGPRQGYTYGPSITKLQADLSKEIQLAGIAKPVLEQLSADCDDETCFLGYFHEFYVESLLTVLSIKLLSLRENPKKLENLHAMAQGKVLLAFLEDDQYKRWKRQTKVLERKTPYSITDFSVLEIQLERIREQRFAENEQESELGVYVVSSPICNHIGKSVGCVSVGVPWVRMNQNNRETYRENVKKKSNVISEMLGYINPDKKG
jgi:IclR family KDG regulon transcriptional repressor